MGTQCTLNTAQIPMTTSMTMHPQPIPIPLPIPVPTPLYLPQSLKILDSKISMYFFFSLNYENKNSFQSSAFQLDDICVASIPFAKTVGVTCTPRER